MVDLSVILPTYNEVGNIVPLIEAIKKNVPPSSSYEILVMDDDSPDGTARAARDAFAGDDSVVVHVRTDNKGLAPSIRDGLDRARGERVVVMDTDFTHDPAEIPNMLHVGAAYDLVSGSRFCPGGAMQSSAHYLSSYYFNRVLRVILRTQVQDNLGGFFTARTAQIRALPIDRIFYGYGDYFFRLLHFAASAGYSMVEVPAIYRQRTSGSSKSNFFKMLFSYSWEALRLVTKRRTLLRRYPRRRARGPSSRTSRR